jgi:diadenosine tetraphosphate (Ap4A) HIT family hydrolase
MCVCAGWRPRGHPEFQAHRDKLVVRIINVLTCFASHRSLGDICPPAHHRSYSFLDINPLARGHALVIPKCSFVFFYYFKKKLLGWADLAVLYVFFWPSL